jgi:lycopene beta-cyclase
MMWVEKYGAFTSVKKVKTNLLIAGGGLASCLLAYRIKLLLPDFDFLIVERNHQLGGNHNWSFHTTDINNSQFEWLSPLISYRWNDHDVVFPNHSRTIKRGYNTIASVDMHKKLIPIIGSHVLFNRSIKSLNNKEAQLNDGTLIEANIVINAMGHSLNKDIAIAYQKFLGIEIELNEPHNLQRPILMDASVNQQDGYRFIYTLPFDIRKLLVEDTRYSENILINEDEYLVEIKKYIDSKGWGNYKIINREKGALPIILNGNYSSFIDKEIAMIGMKGLLCHPTTGYSIPHAVQLAELITDELSKKGNDVTQKIKQYSIHSWKRDEFFRILNRMLFWACKPLDRYKIFQRFYTLPESLIAKFYSREYSFLEKLKMLIGMMDGFKPPVKITNALKAMYRNE